MQVPNLGIGPPRGGPSPRRSIRMIELAPNPKIVSGAQLLTGKILSAKYLPAWPQVARANRARPNPFLRSGGRQGRRSLRNVRACDSETICTRLGFAFAGAKGAFGSSGFLALAFQGALQGLVQSGFGFFVFLLADSPLFVFDFQLEEFFF
jgi:hypothetical protein